MFNKMKLTAAMSVLAASMVFTACNEQESKTEVKKEVPDATPAPSKSVVVYYSQNGATKKLAEIFQKAKDASAVELKLVTPYPSTYDSTIVAVKAQREGKQWPALENAKVELAKYDTVYLGYPIMFGTFAPPIYTFLDSNDLSGKVVVPFCTYGSGGRKASAAELKTLEPGANVTLAYGISNKRMNAENGAEVAASEVEAFFGNLETGKTDEMLMGGFSEQRPLAAEDSAVFAEATKDYAYLGLRPLSVSTQIVAGTNYLFVCEMKAFGGPAMQTNVKIFKPLPGRGVAEMIVVEQ
ncbi:Flavodoxin [Fibrobacter sp. UWB15]|uniref:flavodoxin n=1 Tax=unclassified Fibrobacter TaxID=2634177 RepID=UPI0009183287|nr:MULTISPECIES: flavodoxin [unclassified Fibrobacter]PWJ66476.1 flavodoxin-like protein [Fibrobacter sp. UWB6]SHG02682.1 Flavodoxin [Fibrobacter sp. UWB8]SMG22056.1 Flavodoxin [Fibrobacter sp. UWB15]